MLKITKFIYCRTNTKYSQVKIVNFKTSSIDFLYKVDLKSSLPIILLYEQWNLEKEEQSVNNVCKLLNEANDRLNQAIQNKNLSEISLAQGMAEGSKSKSLW